MNQRVKSVFLLALVVPLGGVYAVDKANEELTLQSLDVITRKVDDAPALLLLTPSQLEAANSLPARTVAKTTKNQLVNLGPKPSPVPIRELKVQQAKINQLNATLTKQSNELKQLRQIAKDDVKARSEIERLDTSLQANLKNTEKMRQQLAAMTAAQSSKKQDDVKSQLLLEKSQRQNLAQQKQIDTLTASQDEWAKKNHDLLQELAALKQTQAKQQVAIVVPKSTAEIRDYAIGSSLGGDVLALLKEKVSQGIAVNDRMAFAGVRDALNGKPQLPQDKIAKALYEMEVVLKEQEKQLKTKTELQGTRYIAQFKKQKQARQDSSGFYYRVDYVGAGKIEPTDTVAVVVKESLADGKVIKDMDVAGTSISQPLDSYPPMFQAAIRQLQNHGSMTMVVPPTLAYGDKGLPPDIPPGSTMVYNVRILDVLPSSEVASVAQ